MESSNRRYKFTGSTFYRLSFVSVLSSYFYFDKILQHAIYVEICHRTKLQAFAKMQMISNQPQLSKIEAFFEN